METITFRCTSCSSTLKAPVEKAGKRVRCGGCNAVVVIPAPEIVEAENDVQPSAAEPVAEARKVKKAKPQAEEDAVDSEPASEGRKRPRRGKSAKRSEELRRAPGWRMVRLGLIQIALWLLLVVVTTIVATFRVPIWLPLIYALQALPILGYVLCVFVPLKGAARILALANLAVIALGLTLTVTLRSMGGFPFEGLQDSGQSSGRSKELDKKAAEALQEEMKKIVAETMKQMQSGNKEALSKPQFEFQIPFKWRLQILLSQWAFWQVSLQIIILSFFLQAVALALGESELAARCPLLALLALVTLIIFLLSQLALPPSWFINRPVYYIYWTIQYVLGLASVVLQALMIFETCAAIANHLNRRSTKGPESIGEG